MKTNEKSARLGRPLMGHAAARRPESIGFRRRPKRMWAALLWALPGVLLTTSGVQAGAPGDVWSLFNDLSLVFISGITGGDPVAGALSGWALKLIGNQIDSGGGASPDPQVLSALNLIQERLDAFDRHITELNDSIESTKLELKRAVQIAQFNIISAQLQPSASTIERVYDEYKNKWSNVNWLRNKPPTLVSDQKALFQSRIENEIPAAAHTIYSLLVSHAGSPGLLKVWDEMTAYDLPPQGEVVGREWLKRAGLIYAYYAALQLKALALEAELAKSYSTASYTADEAVADLEKDYKKRLLEEIKELPYGSQWSDKWTDHLPNQTDLFIDTSTGFVWTTAQAITGKATVWLGWPDGNNRYSAPTLEPMKTWLAENNLVLPTIEEFTKTFRAFGPKLSWPGKRSGDLGEFLAWYLGGAFTYKASVEWSDFDPLIPCVWIDTPAGPASKITTSYSRSRTVPGYGSTTLKVDATKLNAVDGRPEISSNPSIITFYTRLPARECTVVAFRAKKIDGTSARAN
jgi:hypothetical protein